MMKKSILSLIAGAIVALASCSQTDEMPGQPQEGEQPATFTIQTPAVTRADVTGDLSRFIVEAYEGSSVTGTPAARVEAATGTLTLGLKKNTVYTFVFWADKGTAKDENIGTASNGYWDAADLKAVKVTFGRGSVKGEVAYCLAKTFNSKDFEANKTVTLRNATAQVNFVEAAGLSAADNTLTVTYSAGATLNVGTGKVTEVSEAITHIFINIGQVSAGATLATDYILAPKGEQMVRDLTLKLNTEDPKSVTNVPFEQCFKTNIKGEYSSLGQFTFTITADNEWNKPDHEYDPAVWDGTYPANAADAKALMTTAMTTDDGATAADYVFTIRTASQLATLSYLANEDVYIDGTNNGKYTEAHYLLATDIDLNNRPWTPISNSLNYEFLGTFDGQGHTVSNMKVEAKPDRYTCYCGLFGRVGRVDQSTEAIIRNLIVEGTVTANPDNADANCYAGGICGTISNAILQYCRFNGTVSSQAHDDNENRAGGLAGKLSEPGTMQACISNATVTSTGGLDNSTGTGGLTGHFNNVNNYGTTKCINSAWNSALTADGIGKFQYGSIDASNKSFTDISGLNALLNDMNSNVADRTYEWKAATGADAYPTLVKKTN